MAFTIGVLIEALVLFINALAILNEDRFLKPIGWGYRPPSEMDQENIKDRIVGFLNAIRMLMRIPLIFVNISIVILELLLG